MRLTYPLNSYDLTGSNGFDVRESNGYSGASGARNTSHKSRITDHETPITTHYSLPASRR
jgi:hypothetical protein